MKKSCKSLHLTACIETEKYSLYIFSSSPINYLTPSLFLIQFVRGGSFARLFFAVILTIISCLVSVFYLFVLSCAVNLFLHMLLTLTGLKDTHKQFALELKTRKWFLGQHWLLYLGPMSRCDQHSGPMEKSRTPLAKIQAQTMM